MMVRSRTTKISSTGTTGGRHAYLCVAFVTYVTHVIASQKAPYYLNFQSSYRSHGLSPAEILAQFADGSRNASYLCQCKEILWSPGPETGTYQGSPVVEEHYALEKKLRLAEELKQDFDIMFYGDSITKRWLDKDSGLPSLRRVFHKFNPLVMGVGGDQVGNLWWRLMNGEVPTRFQPKVVVLLIGTNDLGAIESCARNGEDDLAATVGINSRIKHVVAYLREKLPRSYIVVLGVLPRSGWTLPERNGWPNRLTPAIEAINNGSKALHQEDNYVHWLDCGPAFYNQSGLLPELYTDGLHLTTLGYDVLAACLQPSVEILWYQASLPSHTGKPSTIVLPEGSNSTAPSKEEACREPPPGSGGAKDSHSRKSAASSKEGDSADKAEESDLKRESRGKGSAEVARDDAEKEGDKDVPAPAPSSDDEDRLFAGRMAAAQPLKALAPIKGCVYCERDTYTYTEEGSD